MNNNVAVVVDGLNALESIREEKGLYERTVVEKFDKWLEIAHSEGLIKLLRVIAPFDSEVFRNNHWIGPLLMSRGFELIHAPYLNSGVNKSIDDMLVALEISRITYRFPEITVLVCISGDGHFFPAINEFRLTGRKAIIISNGNASQALKKCADSFIQEYELKNEQQDSEIKQTPVNEKYLKDELLQNINKLISKERLTRDKLKEMLHSEYNYPMYWLEERIHSYYSSMVLAYNESNGLKIVIMGPNSPYYSN